MTEQAPEDSPIPAPSPLETVARLAAEAALRSILDPEARLAAVENALQEIVQTLKIAAGPDGNAARLASRLESVEQQLQALAAIPELEQQLQALAERLTTAEQQLQDLSSRPVQPHPEQQKLIDDLRLQAATHARSIKALERTPE